MAIYNCFMRVTAAVFLIIALSFSAVAQSDVLSSKDYFDMEYIGDVQISPDGSKIVYVRSFFDIMTDSQYSNIWIVNFDGTGNRPLTSGRFYDGSPRWSHDGSNLIFMSNRSGSGQIHRLWIDTRQIDVVTNLSTSPGSISMSPDGKYITFTQHVRSAPSRIAELPSPPAGARWAKPAEVVDRYLYRGRGLSNYTGYTHQYVVPAWGGTPRKVTSGDFDYYGAAEWSKDGKSILLSVNKGDEFDFIGYQKDIYEFSIADGSFKRLTDRIGPENSPVISPDGKYIAYTGFDNKYQAYQVSGLYVMNQDGSNQRLISGKLDKNVGSIKWAPDGKGLYCLYTDHGTMKLAYISLDGKIKVITADVGVGKSADAGGMYSIAPNGNYAFTYTRPEFPGELAVCSLGSSKMRVITRINEDVLGCKRIGSVEEIWYKSSFDGLDIQGWIVKPPDFDPAKKYPLILEIHGGPSDNYGERFDFEKQVFAANGYVVLYTNPRGSDGYGEEFGNLIHHDYPGDDFYDLNSGVDALVKTGYINEDNMFVCGGSGGGVLTCWMVVKSNRFCAAVARYPMVNWFSVAGTSYIPNIITKYWFKDRPWENIDEYVRRSPYLQVGNVTTPTMLLCGENDYVTPISESEQFYRALRMNGVESVLIRVPNAGHGASPAPSLFISRIQYQVGWFDKYMK